MLIPFLDRTRGNGRLGLQSLPEVRGPGIPFPIEVKIPGVRIVSLTAGGMWGKSLCRSSTKLIAEVYHRTGPSMHWTPKGPFMSGVRCSYYMHASVC